MDLPAPSTAQRAGALAPWQRNMEIGLTTPPAIAQRTEAPALWRPNAKIGLPLVTNATFFAKNRSAILGLRKRPQQKPRWESIDKRTLV